MQRKRLPVDQLAQLVALVDQVDQFSAEQVMVAALSGLIARNEDQAPGPIAQYGEVELAQQRLALHAALAELPEQQKKVIASHYLQGMQFERIAIHLNLTKGRISQVHKAALRSLRHRLKIHRGG
nr:sigma-70 family RNA polymerase sigma factor [uncultured Roseateles sp.]